MKHSAYILIGLLGMGQCGLSQQLKPLVDAQLPELLAEYKDLHSHPELSHHEEKTAAAFATQLRAAGYVVTEHVGKYPDGSQAFGVVGVYKNGPGKTLLLRTEFDALPVIEETGAPYASKVKTQNAAGQTIGVMHACGHDLHYVSVLGTARLMVALKTQWKGTLIIDGQPSEETNDGATAMLNDGMYQRFGMPDYVVGLHDTNNFAAGQVSVVSGPALSSTTSVDVSMRGFGSHGSTPSEGKDPIVMAAEFIVALQTVVSRQIPSREPAVVTIGDIHGGSKRNIIPDEVKMELTTRSYDEKTRQTILAGIKHTADGIAETMGMPADRMPVVNVLDWHPVTYNDPDLSARLQSIFVNVLGKDSVIRGWPVMNGDDFSQLSLDGKVPAVLYWLGIEPPDRMAESLKSGVALPSPHSPLFLPDAEPSVRTGVFTLTTASLDLLSGK